MQSKSNTSISVSVSVDTADCVKSVLENSKFMDKINKEGLTVDDTSKLLRLAIVNLLNADINTIKKSILYSDSDAKLLSFLKGQVGGKNWSKHYTAFTTWSPLYNVPTFLKRTPTHGISVKHVKTDQPIRAGILKWYARRNYRRSSHMS